MERWDRACTYGLEIGSPAGVFYILKNPETESGYTVQVLGYRGVTALDSGWLEPYIKQ